PERFVLCGYSLGGRVALHVALSAPERVSRLVLVSCSAGIEDPAERSKRRASDIQLAADLETRPFEEFIECWRTQPLFVSDPPHVDRLARADQRRNRPASLAAAMRGLGTGEMAPLWSQLGDLAMPTTIVAGDRDLKFVALGERMAAAVGHALYEVIAGGHRLPLENGRALARSIALPSNGIGDSEARRRGSDSR
ncbi:MAG: alpha/beta fold hydrolase, partial [Solirubrobacteraceae bacterium]